MKFYDEKEQLYFGYDTSGVCLGAGLLPVREGMTCPRDVTPDAAMLRPIAFASKSVSNAETHYSNIQREALGILHGLQKFHHYYFAIKVQIMDHKPLVTIFKKDVATLLQKLYKTPGMRKLMLD